MPAYDSSQDNQVRATPPERYLGSVHKTKSLLADTGSFGQIGSASDLRPFDFLNKDNETVIRKLKTKKRRFQDFEDLREHIQLSKKFREEDSIAKTEPLDSH